MLCCYILSIPSLKVKSHILWFRWEMVARQTPEHGGLGTENLYVSDADENAIKEKENGSSPQNSVTSSELM